MSPYSVFHRIRIHRIPEAFLDPKIPFRKNTIRAIVVLMFVAMPPCWRAWALAFDRAPARKFGGKQNSFFRVISP
ncbi:MAG: hypothetical protein ABSC22_18360 [Roseiarcus sp.]